MFLNTDHRAVSRRSWNQTIFGSKPALTPLSACSTSAGIDFRIFCASLTGAGSSYGLAIASNGASCALSSAISALSGATACSTICLSSLFILFSLGLHTAVHFRLPLLLRAISLGVGSTLSFDWSASDSKESHKVLSEGTGDGPRGAKGVASI